ncbi:uncharacterized protein Gasu_38300 [Galdieria sulphuraria]|uniref:Uncharacterized protein n=1 Tax=Galdieria sulphuraria TaxID=130081 RepID=M2XFJ4_GALSU|nr:uncharacterized protein Gasu_38300 [Galdieria sulphuraria]EME28782.1 hypothetical protein Gasu_38300 [Galdieria sulphuraria]|eukprot:XP_005705302.1 hypothetical protein Gasu_38300 [Galdieria sulphuraria]
MTKTPVSYSLSEMPLVSFAERCSSLASFETTCVKQLIRHKLIQQNLNSKGYHTRHKLMGRYVLVVVELDGQILLSEELEQLEIYCR